MSKFVEELLSKMTLEEKAAQMVQIPYNYVGKEEAIKWAKRGAGSFLHVLGDDAREIQKIAMESAHGIPVIFGIDAIHGHCLNENATVFPSQLAMACSFNREIIEKAGRVTAKEVATDGLHWTFSPVLCLGRDTRWGRVNETFGEDPYLAGELGAAIIKGYQGETLSDDDSILACAKHYIGYGEALGGRDACDTEMSYRKMKDVFLPPFKKAVDAGCATFMTAYGSIDGEPFTSSRKALKDILRDELGFEGFVVTDWDNVNSLITNQHVAEDIRQASQMAAEAGNDMIMTSHEFYDAVIELVKNGRLEESVIDDAVRHILEIKYKMGLFEKPEKKGIPGCIGCEKHLEINKQIASESVVLMKNNGILPFNSDLKIAVIGPNADDIKAQYGDWTYFTHPDPKPDKKPVRPYVTVLEGMKNLASGKVIYEKGCSVIDENESNIANAVKIAEDSDAVVLVIGDEISQFGEYKDRCNLELSGKQTELFWAIKKTGKPVITVFVASKPLCIEQIAMNSDALLIAFNGGMFGGKAVSEIIYGKINPSGRLPISFPRKTGQLPVYYNSLPGWHGGKYMDAPADSLFTFGEGISYTKYEYDNLVVNPNTLDVSVDVTNLGDIDGDETVQLYYRDIVSSLLTPVKQLVGFKKIHIKAGEKRTVSFKLEKEDLAFVGKNERKIFEPGEFLIMVGHSSRDEDLIMTKIVL